MNLGRVTGRVVATTRVEGLEGMRFLLVEPLAPDGSVISSAEGGATVVAADATGQAGTGQEIYFVASREAAVALDPWFVPVDHAIVGIVDEVEHPGRG